MKGRKDNTDDRKRQGQHKIQNTNMDRHGPDKSSKCGVSPQICGDTITVT